MSVPPSAKPPSSSTPPSSPSPPPTPAPTLAPALALRVFLPFALGYYLSYIFRSVNAALAPVMVTDLGMEPGALGLLAGAYFLAFALFQLPLGLLLDRYGPRRVQAVLLAVATVGAAGFGLADSLPGLMTARFVIGLGVSGCLMAAFKALAQWFPPARLPLLNGLVMAAGGLGALTATAPAEALAAWLGWRSVFLACAGLSVLTGLAVILAVPATGRDGHPEPLGKAIAGLRLVFAAPVFWRLAPATMATQASMMAIQSLWAGPWLTDVAGRTPGEAAGLLFWVAAAMVAGFLSLGAIADRLGRRGIPVFHVAVTGMGIFVLLQAVLAWGPADWAVEPLWVLFGFFGTTGILNYAVLTQFYDARLSGRVNTAVNLLVFTAAFAYQWAMGLLVEASGGYAVPIAVGVVIQALAVGRMALGGSPEPRRRPA